jgi:serine/threonine protein kinase
MLYREALISKRLIHANIVPFRGVTLNPLQIMTEWMSGGDLTVYIKLNPHANRVALVSLALPPSKHGLTCHAVGRYRGGTSLPSLFVMSFTETLKE